MHSLVQMSYVVQRSTSHQPDIASAAVAGNPSRLDEYESAPLIPAARAANWRRYRHGNGTMALKGEDYGDV